MTARRSRGVGDSGNTVSLPRVQSMLRSTLSVFSPTIWPQFDFLSRGRWNIHESPRRTEPCASPTAMSSNGASLSGAGAPVTAGTVRPVARALHTIRPRAISVARCERRGLSVPIWATAVWESDSAEHAYDMAHSGADGFIRVTATRRCRRSPMLLPTSKMEHLHLPLAWALLRVLLRLVFDRQSHCCHHPDLWNHRHVPQRPCRRMGIETTWVNGSKPGAMALR